VLFDHAEEREMTLEKSGSVRKRFLDDFGAWNVRIETAVTTPRVPSALMQY
jgi:hypothetical protein